MLKSKNFKFFNKNQLKKIICIGFGKQIIDVKKFCINNLIKFEWYTGSRQFNNSNKYEIKKKEELKKLRIYPKIVKNLNNLTNPQDETLVISIGSPFIIDKKFIKKFFGKVINHHASPLPELRGGGEFSWVILSNSKKGAITFHLIDKGVDTGPIIFQKKFTFPKLLRYPLDYQDFTYNKFKNSINLVLNKINSGKSFKLNYQNHALSSYFPRLNTDLQGYIDWSWKGEEIERFILAFSYPYNGASTFVQKRLIRIYNCIFFKKKKFQHSFNYGLVFKYFKNHFFVICLGGYLKITISDIKSIKKIKLGDKLYTPHHKIQKASETRIRYNFKGLIKKKSR